jgi:hypothetical protein
MSKKDIPVKQWRIGGIPIIIIPMPKTYSVATFGGVRFKNAPLSVDLFSLISQ